MSLIQIDRSFEEKKCLFCHNLLTLDKFSTRYICQSCPFHIKLFDTQKTNEFFTITPLNVYDSIFYSAIYRRNRSGSIIEFGNNRTIFNDNRTISLKHICPIKLFALMVDISEMTKFFNKHYK